MSKTQLRKVTVVINKRTLLCKEVVEKFGLFLKVHDKFAIVQQRWNTRYLFRNIFNIDKYDFGLVLLSNKLSDNRE